MVADVGMAMSFDVIFDDMLESASYRRPSNRHKGLFTIPSVNCTYDEGWPRMDREAETNKRIFGFCSGLSNGSGFI